MKTRSNTSFLICVSFLAAALLLPKSATADGLRDPTRPPIVAASRATLEHEAPPVLSAIIGVKGERCAIFNGELVRRGGSVGTYAIEAVFDDGVRYRHAGLSQELYLPRNAIFKRPSTAPARPPAGVP